MPPSPSAPATASVLGPGHVTPARPPVELLHEPSDGAQQEAQAAAAPATAPARRKQRTYKFTPAGKRAVDYALSQPWLEDLPLEWRALYQRTCMRFGCRRAPPSSSGAGKGTGDAPIEIDCDPPAPRVGDSEPPSARTSAAATPAGSPAQGNVPVAARCPTAAPAAAPAAGMAADSARGGEQRLGGSSAVPAAKDSETGGARGEEDPAAVPPRQVYPYALRAAHQGIAACPVWEGASLSAEGVAAAVESDDPIAALAQAVLPAAALAQFPQAVFASCAPAAVDAAEPAGTHVRSVPQAGPVRGVASTDGGAVPQSGVADGSGAAVQFTRVKIRPDADPASAGTTAAGGASVIDGLGRKAGGCSSEPPATQPAAAAVCDAAGPALDGSHGLPEQVHQAAGGVQCANGAAADSAQDTGAGVPAVAATGAVEERVETACVAGAAQTPTLLTPADELLRARESGRPARSAAVSPVTQSASYLGESGIAQEGGSGGGGRLVGRSEGTNAAAVQVGQQDRSTSVELQRHRGTESARHVASGERVAPPKRVGLMRVGVKRRQVDDEEEDDAPLQSRKAAAHPRQEAGAWRRAWAQRLKAAAADAPGTSAAVSPPAAAGEATAHSPAVPDAHAAGNSAPGTVQPSAQISGSGGDVETSPENSADVLPAPPCREPAVRSAAAPHPETACRGRIPGTCADSVDPQSSPAAAHRPQQCAKGVDGPPFSHAFAGRRPEPAGPARAARCSPGVAASPLRQLPSSGIVPETCMPDSGMPGPTDPARAGAGMRPPQPTAADCTPAHAPFADSVPVVPSTIGDVIPETVELDILPVEVPEQPPAGVSATLSADSHMHAPALLDGAVCAAVPEPSPCMGVSTLPAAGTPAHLTPWISEICDMHDRHAPASARVRSPSLGAHGVAGAAAVGSPCSPTIRNMGASGNFPADVGPDCIPDTPDDAEVSPSQPSDAAAPVHLTAPSARPLFAVPAPVTFQVIPPPDLVPTASVERVGAPSLAATRSSSCAAPPCRVPDIFAMSPCQPAAAPPLDTGGAAAAAAAAVPCPRLQLNTAPSDPRVCGPVPSHSDSPSLSPIGGRPASGGASPSDHMPGSGSKGRPCGLQPCEPTCMGMHRWTQDCKAVAPARVAGEAAPPAAAAGRSSASTGDMVHGGGTPGSLTATGAADTFAVGVAPAVAAVLRRDSTTRSCDGGAARRSGGGFPIDMTLESPERSPLLAARALVGAGTLTTEREMLHDSSEDEAERGEARARRRAKPVRPCLDDTESDGGVEGARAEADINSDVEVLTGACSRTFNALALFCAPYLHRVAAECRPGIQAFACLAS